MHLCHKDQLVNVKETISVFCEDHMEPINTLYERNAELVNV
jgi:hypothetical protein